MRAKFYECIWCGVTFASGVRVKYCSETCGDHYRRSTLDKVTWKDGSEVGVREMECVLKALEMLG